MAFGVNLIFGFPPIVVPGAGTRLGALTSASLPCAGASLSPTAALFRALNVLRGTVGCCGGSDMLMVYFAVTAKFENDRRETMVHAPSPKIQGQSDGMIFMLSTGNPPFLDDFQHRFISQISHCTPTEFLLLLFSSFGDILL
jgi:hypothetical protein